ncbi:uncharacterized protein EV420DRAFT_1488699 [Desarmillaria tabescens]|uniref:Uncharacterized protein n=1 Tax=Armillaria tabescens TaxID=1929756 RepID=A0AA39J1G0_ARMTA|nr:uncharacterized protein EV420DRAFT_1488699 [Desarmillaria tabescens]KAK0434380.1 hypothetical protein EV420DRAFT_1488699 [Desarmillaria tabescens]
MVFMVWSIVSRFPESAGDGRKEKEHQTLRKLRELSSNATTSPRIADFQPAWILSSINASSSTSGLLKRRIAELEEEVVVLKGTQVKHCVRSAKDEQAEKIELSRSPPNSNSGKRLAAKREEQEGDHTV